MNLTPEARAQGIWAAHANGDAQPAATLFSALGDVLDGLAAARREHTATVARLEGERDDAHTYATRIAQKHEALSVLLNGPNSRLPQDVRDRAKIGRHVADAAADLLVELARERDELRATLLNERGEGEPPREGWAYERGTWCKGDWTIWRDTELDGGAAWVADWGGESMFDRPTARECMRHAEADAALAAGGKA